MTLAPAQSGLKERRVIADFTENTFPKLKLEIQKAAGYPVEVEVDWNGMYHQTAACQYWGENMTKIYFEPMIATLNAICVDDMGKEALSAKVKKIKFMNTKSAYSNCSSLDGDTFIFDHAPDSNVDYVKDRVKDMQNFLENNL